MNHFQLLFGGLARRGSHFIEFPDVPPDQIVNDETLEKDMEVGEVAIGRYRNQTVIVIKYARGFVIISDLPSTKRQWRVFAPSDVIAFMNKPMEFDGSCVIDDEMLRFMLGNQTNGENNFINRVLSHPFR